MHPHRDIPIDDENHNDMPDHGRRQLFQKAGTIAIAAGSSTMEPFVSQNFIPTRTTTNVANDSIMAAWAATATSSLSTDPDPVLFELLPQFLTVDDVPKEYFDNQRYIYAFVERVIDGDTIRVRHVPGYGYGRKVPQPLEKRGISGDTLSIRIYGVDTPGAYVCGKAHMSIHNRKTR